MSSIDPEVIRRELPPLAGDVEAFLADLTAPGPVACLTAGVSGSGKSLLSRALARAGFTRVSIDGVRWEAGGPAAPWDDAYDHAAEREVERRTATLLAAGTPVVVDVAACSRSARDRYRTLVHQAGGRLVLVHLEAAPAVLAERVRGRTYRHADDVPVPSDVLARYLRGFEPPVDEGAHRLRTDAPG